MSAPGALLIYWLLQSTVAHPALARGEPPTGLLAPEEETELAQFTSPQRRSDWLLGRWTAKRLLQQIVSRQGSAPPDSAAILILSGPNGAPHTTLRDPGSGRTFNLSLSHSHDYALCAATAGRPIGVDLETIEPRPVGFEDAFFNVDERALVNPRKRDMHITAIWSAKEAALKAGGAGLRRDPLQVSCLVQPVAVEPQDWMPFQIEWRRELAMKATLPRLAGWWQVLGDLVLALATTAEAGELSGAELQ